MGGQIGLLSETKEGEPFDYTSRLTQFLGSSVRTLDLQGQITYLLTCCFPEYWKQYPYQITKPLTAYTLLSCIDKGDFHTLKSYLPPLLVAEPIHEAPKAEILVASVEADKTDVYVELSISNPGDSGEKVAYDQQDPFLTGDTECRTR